MLKICVFFLLFVSVSLARLSVTPLVNNTRTVGTLPSPTSDAGNYELRLYSVQIPERAKQVTVSFENTDSAACEHLNVFISTSPPCPKGTTPGTADTSSYACEAYNLESGAQEGNWTQILRPGLRTGHYEWRVGSATYIGVGRDTIYNATCSFAIKVEIEACQAGYVSFYEAVNTQATYCIPVATAPAGVTIPVPPLSSEAIFAGKVTLPQGIGSLRGYLNATTATLNIFGMNYGVPSATTYDCASVAPEEIEPDLWQYVLECQFVQSGSFYFVLLDNPSAPEFFNTTVLLELTACGANSDVGGWNCTDSLSEFDPTTSNGVAYPVEFETFRYFYIDVTPNVDTHISINAVTNDTARIFIRRDGFPSTANGPFGRGGDSPFNSARITDAAPGLKVLTKYDTYEGGRWYFGATNEDVAPVSVTFTVSITENTTPPTQEDTTAPVETTSDEEPSGSASTLAYSLCALLAGFIAVLY